MAVKCTITKKKSGRYARTIMHHPVNAFSSLYRRTRLRRHAREGRGARDAYDGHDGRGSCDGRPVRAPCLFDERAELLFFFSAQRVQRCLAMPERAGDRPERIGKPAVARGSALLLFKLRIHGVQGGVLRMILLTLLLVARQHARLGIGLPHMTAGRGQVALPAASGANARRFLHTLSSTASCGAFLPCSFNPRRRGRKGYAHV